MSTPVPPEFVGAAADIAKESVLGSLGVNWKLFVAQLANFAVVLFVMWKWVYKPLLKIIDARTAKIENGLRDADAAASAKSGAEREAGEAILAARREAQRLLEEAQKQADAHHAEAKAKTQQELASLIQQGKDTLASEKEKMVQSARAELAELAVDAAKKALGTVLTEQQKKTLLEEAVKRLKS